MPTDITLLLMIIFAIHFTVFLRRYLKKRQKTDILVCLTFIFLIVSLSLRHWLMTLSIGPLPLYWFPRAAAWCTTGLFLFYRFRRS